MNGKNSHKPVFINIILMITKNICVGNLPIFLSLQYLIYFSCDLPSCLWLSYSDSLFLHCGCSEYHVHVNPSKWIKEEVHVANGSASHPFVSIPVRFNFLGCYFLT